jgi:UDPglucose 6-dehydrogenase
VSGQPRLTVIGTGYLGTTHAACMAELGFQVLGLDVDPERVADLGAGRLPFYEPGLADLLRRGLDSGRLRFTSSYREIADAGDVHFVCVGTPQRRDSQAADLSQVESAFRSLASVLDRPALVVGKSTVPAGTAARLATELVRLAPVGPAARLAWNPEFLREGHAVEDTLRPDRLVFGVASGEDEAVLRLMYAPLIKAGAPVVSCDYATAELVKVAANAFLATKISFINAMAEVCEATGADVRALSAALAHDGRIGGRFLQAGLGFGGGCLPKDIRAFAARANELGVTSAVGLLEVVDAINVRCRSRMLDLAASLVGGGLAGARVGVLGAAFKPGSDDVRDSPGLQIAGWLVEAGAEVTVTDPQAIGSARRVRPDLRYEPTLERAVSGTDVLLLATEWPEYRQADPAGLGALVRRRRIVDGRGALDPRRWAAAGWEYRGLGRPEWVAGGQPVGGAGRRG